MDIGSKIKKSRTDARITQEQAAEALGVSRQTVSNWENERSYPDIVSVLKMSDLYGVSLDYLLKGEASMKGYLDYIEESTNTVKSKARLSRLILVISYLVIWALNIAASCFFRGRDRSGAGRRVSMACAAGSDDNPVIFDWEKQSLGKAQVACIHWLGRDVHAFRLCGRWHEGKLPFQSARFANAHLFSDRNGCLACGNGDWPCLPRR